MKLTCPCLQLKKSQEAAKLEMRRLQKQVSFIQSAADISGNKVTILTQKDSESDGVVLHLSFWDYIMLFHLLYFAVQLDSSGSSMWPNYKWIIKIN